MVCMNKENDKFHVFLTALTLCPFQHLTHATSTVQALYFLLRLAMKTAVTRMKYALFAPKKDNRLIIDLTFLGFCLVLLIHHF